MSNFSISRWCLILLFLFIAQTSRAHDALASFADLWLAPQTMELTITMSRSAAFLLVKDHEPGFDHVDVDTFAKARPKLLVQESEICHLLTAAKPLAPTSMDVEMTDESDVLFRLIYLRPPAGGPVRFEFPYLPKMVEGHVLTHAVWNEDKTGLHTTELHADESPVVETTLPPSKSATPAIPAPK